MSKNCVQWNILADTETNANNCLNGIQTAINAITTGWENSRNKNSNIKSFGHIENRWRVGGIQRMANETEKNQLINVIRALSSPPFIIGEVHAHKCTHDEEISKPCVIEESWEL